MRITSELLSQVEQRTNPLGDRELILQGLGIPAIENGAATRDAFDCWDLCNNRLGALGNFPKLRRLRCLLCSGNLIESFDARNMAQNLPSMVTLTLAQNRVASFAEIVKLGKALPNLEFLDLTGNPVARRQQYRLFVISQFKMMTVLDFRRVSPTERSEAEKLAFSETGEALGMDTDETGTKTFVPGGNLADDSNKSSSFTEEERSMIKKMLAEATSVQEVERIESSVSRGVLPMAK